MWKSYLNAALRNLSRNRLHAAITTLSLAVGFSAMILAALYWRHETTYDRFWPNAERLVLAAQWTYQNDGSPLTNDAAETGLAPLASDLPGVEAVARTKPAKMELARGSVRALENHVHWADPNLFSVLTPRRIAGALDDALARPNSIVLTRSLARKYFGDADPVGQILTVAPFGEEDSPVIEPLAARVTAVIEDMPENSHVEASAFLSGVSAGSPLNTAGATAYTYILARSVQARAGMAAELDRLAKVNFAVGQGREQRSVFKPLPLEQVYLKPAGYGVVNGGRSSIGGLKEGDRSNLQAAAAMAGLILAVAAINFVIIMTARGARRAVEVGVRKVSGALRRDLVLQFIGEALVYVVLAFVLGLACAELALPTIRAVTGLGLRFDYGRDLGLVGLTLVAALGLGAAAGLYPALALASFRPARALKGGAVRTHGSTRLRHALIAAQFTPLILLALGALMFDSQTRRTIANSMAMLDPGALMIEEACTPALKAQIAALPGVTRVICMQNGARHSSGSVSAPMVGAMNIRTEARTRTDQTTRVYVGAVDEGAIEFHGMRLLAGKLFTPAQSGDMGAVVINETAREALGYANPAAAVGQTLNWKQTDWEDNQAWRGSTIIGVVTDRGGASGFEAGVYYLDPAAAVAGMSLRIAPGAQAATLAGIDRIWAAAGKTSPMKRNFYGDDVRDNFRESLRFGWTMGASTMVGMFVAALGLFGLSAFLAEQRTKEIGVRKALGASRAQVLRRLLVQFAWPVILANLIACPLGYGVVSILQNGQPVARRFPLGPDIFLPVIGGSLLIAFLAVFANAWQVSSERPVKALRYE